MKNKGTSLVYALIIIALLVLLLAYTYHSVSSSETVNQLITSKEKARSSAPGPVGKFYPVNITGQTSISVVVSGNNTRTELIQENLSISKATLRQMILDANGTYNYVAQTQGSAAAQKWLNDSLRSIDNQSDPVQFTVTEVKSGNRSIYYGNTLGYLLCTKGGCVFRSEDPVNLVFYNVGSAWDVQYDMQYWVPNRWTGGACGNDLQLYINNIPHGGSAGYYYENYQLAYTDPTCTASSRYHIRLYDGGYDTHLIYYHWTAAGVHHEYLNLGCFCHTIYSNGWEDAENFVVSDFSGQWFVGSVYEVWLGNNGYYSGVWNDGWATYIQLID